MLVEKKEVCRPDQALLAVRVVRDVIGRVCVYVAVQQIHFLVDCVPHPGQRSRQVDAKAEERRVEVVHNGAEMSLPAEIGRFENGRKVVV